MGKYFGTDGIRGKANVTLNARTAFDVGRYLGYYFSKNSKGKIIVGKDTRLSSDMFEASLAAGISSSGCDVYLVGYCPTPAIAYLAKEKDFDCGVMISASHNPFYDNGIKIFSHKGVKISSDLEDEIEKFIDNITEVDYATEAKIGKVINYNYGLDLYLDFLRQEYKVDLRGLNIALDCANGASVTTAKKLLELLGASCKVIHNNPNGTNINNKCGSTHPEDLIKLMQNSSYDIGFAFDGDADRLIAFDEKGNMLDGDHIIYACATYLKNKNQLNDNTVVTTVMANLGLYKALEEAGIKTVKTQVGDKYVFEEMDKNNYDLGGEQSGHIIFKKHLTTGDGLQTALNLLKIMLDCNLKASDLSKGLKIYPQLLKNVSVTDKNLAQNDEDVLKEVDLISKELGNNGRILVRPSGTEPLLRVMVEAESDEICSQMVDRVVKIVLEKYKA